MRTRRLAALGAITLLATLSACGRTAVDPASAAGPGQTAQAPQATAAPAAQAPAPTEAPAPVRKPARSFYDLAASVAHAEVRTGRTLVMDFGEEAGSKYDMGGWLTGTGRGRKVGDHAATLVSRERAKLVLPADFEGPARLSIRLRAYRSTPLTVHINEETLADRKLRGKDFEILDLDIPAGRLRRGENLLQLRVGRTGGDPAAGMSIDWIRLAPAGTEPNHEPPADSAHLAPGGGVLVVPADHQLGYILEVPERAQLRADLEAKGDATLEVVAVRDGADDQVLASAQAGATSTALTVDLSGLAGQLARLELRARGAAVVLKSPAVVTLDAPAALTKQKKIDNVLLILIDTLRADKLQAYNDRSRVQTPGLATFLQSATVMKNGRTQENWTKPSVATLLSSLLPWQHKAVTGESRVPNSVEMLPEVLKKRGYYTGSFIANGYVSTKFGFKQGWHTYRNYIREGLRTKAQYVAADVLQWLDKRPKDKPFFLYMHTIDPHVPYRPPQHFLSMYDESNYKGVVNFRAASDLLEKIKIGSIKLKARDKRRLESLYDAEISYHDVHFAKVMEGLKTRGLADNTMVIVTSDHGEEFWDHGSVGHGHSVYDELLRVPIIVRIPGVTDTGGTVTDHVGLVDVMPTVLEALGEPIPDDLSGQSFLGRLRGEGLSAPRTTVSGFMKGWRTLTVGRFKLIHRTISRMWVYDTSADPGETTDLKDAQPMALRYLRAQLGLALADQGSTSNKSKRRVKKTHKHETTDIDEETRRQLEALGYVGSSKR